MLNVNTNTNTNTWKPRSSIPIAIPENQGLQYQYLENCDFQYQYQYRPKHQYLNTNTRYWSCLHHSIRHTASRSHKHEPSMKPQEWMKNKCKAFNNLNRISSNSIYLTGRVFVWWYILIGILVACCYRLLTDFPIINRFWHTRNSLSLSPYFCNIQCLLHILSYSPTAQNSSRVSSLPQCCWRMGQKWMVLLTANTIRLLTLPQIV